MRKNLSIKIGLLTFLYFLLQPQQTHAINSLTCEKYYKSNFGKLSEPLSFKSIDTDKQQDFLKKQFKQITSLIKENPNNILTWTETPLKGQIEAFDKMKIVRLTSGSYPFELQINDQTKFKLVKLLGEGKRGQVYLTSDGFALKVLKQLDQPRELILQAWSEKLWQDKKVLVPKVHYVDPLGNYLVQEYIQGKTLLEEVKITQQTLDLNKTLKNQFSESLINEVLLIRKKSLDVRKKLGLFFDLKAANFILTPSGKLYFVDTGIRVDENKSKYYEDPSGKTLSESLFLEYFFLRQYRNEKLQEEFFLEENLLADSTDELQRLTAIIKRNEVKTLGGVNLSEA
ncbi:MAG: hypothetical protein KDD45_07725, partial [Bdellovibrionales bacterium]|nr:hypothetical protein [Bdellovibrionales bacterium]